jgi:hypothetical protein
MTEAISMDKSKRLIIDRAIAPKALLEMASEN